MTTTTKPDPTADARVSFEFDDGGGPEAAGLARYTGPATVVRAIAIATGQGYRTVYDELKQLDPDGRFTPRSGTTTIRFRSYLKRLGWEWVSLTDRRSALRHAELPAGPVIASVPRRLVAVVDHVVRDVDPCFDAIVSGYFVQRQQKPSDLEDLRQIVTRKQAEIRGEPLDVSPHPAAELFPMLDEEAFAALKQDIERHGQRVPIAMYGGAVLDGRNRLRACRELGIAPLVVDVPLEVDPWVYVVSLNLRRRHLAPHQAGAIYAKLLEQRGVKRGRGRRNDNLTSATVAEVASELGVPERTMRHQIAAAETYAQLEPATKAAVDSGQLTLDQAAGKPKKKPKAKTREPLAAPAERRAPKPNVVNDEADEDSGEDVWEMEPIVPYADLSEAIDAFHSAMIELAERWPAQHAGMLIKMMRNEATRLEGRRAVND